MQNMLSEAAMIVIGRPFPVLVERYCALITECGASVDRAAFSAGKSNQKYVRKLLGAQVRYESCRVSLDGFLAKSARP